MATLRISGETNVGEAVDAAIHELQSGGVVAVPTDTTYALIADDSHTGASDRLFKLTKRQRTFELTLLVADQGQAESVATGVAAPASVLMEKFWPGALSLVLPRDPDFVADLGSDDETVGVRCPAHIVPRLICERLGPLASVSAGMHGGAAANSANDVIEMFGDQLAVVIDGGTTPGTSATALDATGPNIKLLREGALAWSDIATVLD